MYSRQFLTTAADRRQRMVRRADMMAPVTVAEQAGGGQWRPSAPPLPPISIPPVYPADAVTMNEVNNVPAAHSTRVVNQKVGEPRYLETHDNLSMELEDEGQNQAVTFDPNLQSVDILQGADDHADMDFWSLNANSEATQYREVQNFSRRNGVVNSQTNPFLPGYGGLEQMYRPENNQVNYGRENVYAIAPPPLLSANNACYQLVPQYSQHFMGQQQMSKTDRTVLLELIKNVGTADGTDELQLLKFLKDLKPLFDIAPNSSGEIVKLLIPKTKGQLFKLWVEATTAGVSWENLHCAILSYFLPSARLREIESMELDRPQRPDETFIEYAENVIAVAFALRTKMTEEEVIETVLSKCDPATKAHFAFNDRPRNIVDLKFLANKVTGSIKAERRYFGRPHANICNRNVMQAGRPSFSRQNPQILARSRRSYENSGNQREQIVKCFKCNGEGHIARNCSSLN